MTINRLHLKSLDTHTCLDEVSDYFIPRRKKKKDSTITITSRDKLRITNLSTSTNELKQLTQLSNRALFYICIIIEKPPLTTQDTFFDRISYLLASSSHCSHISIINPTVCFSVLPWSSWILTFPFNHG